MTPAPNRFAEFGRSVLASLVANLVWYILVIPVAALLLGTVVLLTRGLAPWQEFTITTLFALLLIMLGAAIYAATRTNKASTIRTSQPVMNDDAPPPFLHPGRDYSVEERDQTWLRNEFDGLSWSQQAAVALLHNVPAVPPSGLNQLLTQKGFGQDIDKTIIEPLLQTRFVEVGAGGKISLHPARLATITKLVKLWQKRGI
jgi:hypothetical protein